MELEAGDDWLARLAISYEKARVVFVDVRNLTANLENEIVLTYKCLGLERCIFIVDQKDTKNAWLDVISHLLQLEAYARKSIRLALYDPENVEGFFNSVRSHLSTLPPGKAGLADEGLKFASVLSLKNVTITELLL